MKKPCFQKLRRSLEFFSVAASVAFAIVYIVPMAMNSGGSQAHVVPTTFNSPIEAPNYHSGSPVEMDIDFDEARKSFDI